MNEMSLMAKNELSNFTNQPLVNVGLSNLASYEYCYPMLNAFHHYYPTTTCWHVEKNSFEQAFKVIQKLMDKKLIKLDTVKDFMSAISEVAGCL